MITFPYIFAFYSYKGGVGRSMALLNTAYTLAGRGRHVLVLDLDLEAPGLSDFLSRNQEMDEPRAESPGDIIDLLAQVKDAAVNGVPPEKAISKMDAIERFRRSAKSSGVKAPRIGPPGGLDIIPAMIQVIEGESYWQRLAALDLRTTSKDDLQRMGVILARYLQQQRLIVRSPGLDELGITKSVPYDYILIDSRTGITELGGLCVGPLCDRLIVFTALNDQNVSGTRSFLEEAGIRLDVRGADDFRPWDDADPKPGEDMTPPTIGPKPTLLVATPVPYGEIEYKRNRIKELERTLGPVSAKLSYHPQMALIESVFVRNFPEEYLAAEYRDLADRMMASVSDHHVQLARRSLDAWNKRDDAQEAVDAAIRLAGHDFAVGTSFLFELGNRLSSLGEKQFEPAIRLHSTLSGLEGETASTAFFNWGNALSDRAKTKSGAEADRLFG
ncbi:MAG: cobalamin biosynthesis protein CobQ, partial [Candidatus Hydrogenedentota bacterium]